MNDNFSYDNEETNHHSDVDHTNESSSEVFLTSLYDNTNAPKSSLTLKDSSKEDVQSEKALGHCGGPETDKLNDKIKQGTEAEIDKLQALREIKEQRAIINRSLSELEGNKQKEFKSIASQANGPYSEKQLEWIKTNMCHAYLHAEHVNQIYNNMRRNR